MSVILIIIAAIAAASYGVKPNPFVLIMAVMFFIEQNRHFGWNKEPMSDAELIADGITYLLVAFSFVAGGISISITKG